MIYLASGAADVSLELVRNLAPILVATAGLLAAWRASRSSRGARDAAEDVARRTTTNHGKNIGEHMEGLVDWAAETGERLERIEKSQAASHRTLTRAVDVAASTRDSLAEHIRAHEADELAKLDARLRP